jgi:hypothetical protein
MQNRQLLFRLVLVCSFAIVSAGSLAAQSALAETLFGRWLMEDLYTIHVDERAMERIESHRPGAFVTEVQFNANGTGRQGDRAFRWMQNQDEIQWRFEDGGTVSLLVRFLTPDYFLVFARALGQPDNGAAVSGLVRME